MLVMQFVRRPNSSASQTVQIKLVIQDMSGQSPMSGKSPMGLLLLLNLLGPVATWIQFCSECAGQDFCVYFKLIPAGGVKSNEPDMLKGFCVMQAMKAMAMMLTRPEQPFPIRSGGTCRKAQFIQICISSLQIAAFMCLAVMVQHSTTNKIFPAHMGEALTTALHSKIEPSLRLKATKRTL